MRVRRSLTVLVAISLVGVGLAVLPTPSVQAVGGGDTWAAWPGSTPSASATGLSAPPLSVAIDGANVYVGTGVTNSSCGTTAGNLCKWDGTSWTTVGTGNGTNGIATMAVRPGTHDLYVGGNFQQMGTAASDTNGPNMIGRYDGSWHALTSGLPPPSSYCRDLPVTALSFTDANHLLAAFDNYGGASLCSIDLSAGTPTWERVATASSLIYDIAVSSSSEVYVGGSFLSITSYPSGPTTNANYVAVGTLSGSTWAWSALGTGASSTVRAVAVADSTHVYLGGDFTSVDAVNCTGVAMWTGVTAACLGGGFASSSVYDLDVSGGSVYAVGSMSKAGTPNIWRAAYFDGTAWAGMGYGLSGTAKAVAHRSTGNAVVVGDFMSYRTSQATDPAYYIAEWTPPVSVPGAPTGAAATAADAQASVSWTAPTSNGGATITSYTVTSSPGSQSCTATGSPAATSCTVTGLANGTPYTFTVVATNSAGPSPSSSASTAVTPAASGGGGGGGSTTPSTDTPTPSPTSAPTTPPPTPSAPDPLGPEDGPPVTALAPGGTTVTTGGQPTPVTTVPNKAGGTVTSSGDDWSLTTGGRTPAGKSQPTSPTGVVQVPQGGSVLVSGKGYWPGTSVQVYAMNPARLLGTFTVGADGTFAGSLALPGAITPGDAVIQVNGYASAGVVRSYSLGVKVARLAGAKVHTVRKTVYFAAGSSWLSSDTKSTLADAVKAVPKGAKSVSVVCTGYVQGTSDTSNDFTLSTARATKVVAQMKADKLVGKYYVTGRGVAKEAGAKARKVIVTVAYTLS